MAEGFKGIVNAASGRPKLSLKGVTKIYQNGEGVSDIDMEVRPGELLTLLGPSGCGKTTILRVIGGFLVQNSGSIALDGEDIGNLPPERRPTAMVFQNYNLWPHMTVRENLAFGLRLRKVGRPIIDAEVAAILELVGMGGTQKKYPDQLSGGQQQRVAIGRALLLKPEVLLLDEPFSALDAKIRGQMRIELKRIQRELEITVVFVTHDQEEAMSLSDRVVVMNRGGIEQVGSPSEIYDEPASRFVAEFVGKMNFLEPEGDEGTIAIRPEDLELSRGPAMDGALAGTVVSIMVMGPFLEVLVETDRGAGTLKAVVGRGEGASFAVGDRVSLTWAKERRYGRRPAGAGAAEEFNASETTPRGTKE